MWAKKIWEFFEILDPKDLDELELFLQSPYFNRGSGAGTMLLLFESFRDSYQSGSWPDPDLLYAQLFPDEVEIKGKLSKLLSQLTQLIRQFIQQLDWHSREAKNQNALAELRFYRKRGLHQRFEKGLKLLEDRLAHSRGTDQQHMYLQFLLEQERVEFFAFQNKRKSDLNIPKLIERLDWFYLFSKMEFALAFLAQGIHFSLPRNEVEQLLTEVEKLPNGNGFLEIPVVGVYWSMLKYLVREDEGSLDELEFVRSEIQGADEKLLPEQKQMLFGLLRHQVIGAVNRGRLTFLPIAFQIYCEHLEAGYLYYEKKVTSSTYRNMVTMSLRLKQFNWTRTFLDDYRDKLIGADHPEEVYRFNLANLYFHERKFDEALDLLGPKYNDLYYQLAARRLEIKVLFEVQSPLLESKMESFKIYVFRLSQNNLPATQASGNNHFIDLLRRIINPSTLGNDQRINLLRKQFEEAHVLAERNWLDEKLRQLH
ncbi:MAG: hypothetical protein KDC34_05915 [Saprospiraceae bacterium]|nr:hypothetical protein [Saprospiraceae bacterium]